MENLESDPIMLTGRAPSFTAHQNSTTSNQFPELETEGCANYTTQMRISDQHPMLVTNKNPTRLQEYTRKLKHIYVGTFFVMYVSLIGFIQVKYHDGNPFETHVVFIIMSLVALPLAITTSGVLLYTDDPYENSKNSGILHDILNFIFFFSTILAVLSLVLVLFIPVKLNWIGYAIICGLFIFMVAYKFRGSVRIPEKKDASNSSHLEMV